TLPALFALRAALRRPDRASVVPSGAVVGARTAGRGRRETPLLLLHLPPSIVSLGSSRRFPSAGSSSAACHVTFGGRGITRTVGIPGRGSSTPRRATPPPGQTPRPRPRGRPPRSHPSST